VLAVPYRHLLFTARFLLPLVAVGLGILVFVSQRADFFQTVLRSRVDTSGKGTSTHFVVYEFIPQVLSQHPLFGLGLNNFSVYYEFVTGRNNFGPHSFYVALFVETGIVGALLFVAFLGYLFRRLAAGRAIGRALAEAGDGLAARVRPLEWGLTAALVGAMLTTAPPTVTRNTSRSSPAAISPISATSRAKLSGIDQSNSANGTTAGA